MLVRHGGHSFINVFTDGVAMCGVITVWSLLGTTTQVAIEVYALFVFPYGADLCRIQFHGIVWIDGDASFACACGVYVSLNGHSAYRVRLLAPGCGLCIVFRRLGRLRIVVEL